MFPSPSRLALRFVLAALSLSALPAFADEPTLPFLAADFAPGTDPGDLSPTRLAAIDGKLYFSASDPEHGDEPWISDGSAEGTRRLADLCFGFCSSRPGGFAGIGGAVVFFGMNSRGYMAVYRHADGEVAEGPSFDDEISQLVGLGSTAFFTTRAGLLYRTDGTREGTRIVATLHPDPEHQPPPTLGVANEALYYADAGRLYRMAENDSEPRAIFTFGETRPWARVSGYTAVDAGRVIFGACLPAGPASYRCNAWVTDGSATGTRSLELSANGTTTANPSHFLAWRGRIYFEANSFSEPYQRLVSTDGTPEGTRVELVPRDFASLLAATPSRLFYSTEQGLFARNAAADRHLFERGDGKLVGVAGEGVLFDYGDPGGINPPRPGFHRLAISDGTPEGTFDLLDAWPEPGVQLGGRLYFGCAPTATGLSGLWRSDGSAAGTVVARRADDVPRSSLPRAFPAGAVLAVEADDGTPPFSARPRYLHRLDPISLAHDRVAELPVEVRSAGGGKVYLDGGPAGTPPGNFSYDGEHLTQLPYSERTQDGGAFAADGHRFFFAGGFFYSGDSDDGLRLMESDGTAEGTRVRVEFPAGSQCLACNLPAGIAVSGELVFYLYREGVQGFRHRLGVWDRARGENRFLGADLDFLPRVDAFPGGRALFLQRFYEGSEEYFWRSDGSATGTAPFLSVPDLQTPLLVAAAGDRFFLALPARFGDSLPQSLWTGDLGDGGLRQVAVSDGRFLELIPAGERLFFVHDSADRGRELGFTDGSAEGARYFDLRPGPDSSMPRNFYLLADGRLVFAASGDEAGLELWISDGTATGTYRLTDLNPGHAASVPSDFAEAGGRLFFQASDGVRGRELWGIELTPPWSGCPADRLCLRQDRFVVKVTAHAPDGDFVGRPAVAGPESGVFSFFAADNWELMVKVLDGCALNQAFWVVAAAASDVGFTLEVEDRLSHSRKTWEKPAGGGLPVFDLGAFATCAANGH